MGGGAAAAATVAGCTAPSHPRQRSRSRTLRPSAANGGRISHRISPHLAESQEHLSDPELVYQTIEENKDAIEWQNAEYEKYHKKKEL